jgi:hypothetical protein
MHSVEEDITPARAARDLETAECGRKPSMKVIGDYARDMKAGQWHLTHQGVAYDTDKILRDGQQRWWAVIKAATELVEEGVIASADDFSVRMMVTYDMPRESFPFLDGGKNRSLADNWFIEGHANSVLLQSICRRIAMWEAGRPVGNTLRPTRAETMAVLVKHSDAKEAAAFAEAWKVKPPVPSASMAGFLWWLLGTRDEADRDFFMEALRTGSDISENDETKPVLLLRNRLHADHFTARTRGSSVKPETVLYLCLRGWDAWRTKEKISKLQMPIKLNDKSFRAPR